MSDQEAAACAKALVAVWILWFMAKFGFFRNSQRLKTAHIRQRLITRMWAHGIPRLCGYHLGSVNRQGQMAILDSFNCELCAKESGGKVVSLRRNAVAVSPDKGPTDAA